MQKGFARPAVLIMALFLLIGGDFLWSKVLVNKFITDYKSCVKYKPFKPVLLMAPGVCSSPDGRRFTQELSEETKKYLIPPMDASNSDDETTSWKTYTNEKYKYTFKYPEDISFEESENGKFILR